MRMDNQTMVKAEARGGSQPAIVATVPVTARPSMTVLASSCMIHLFIYWLKDWFFKRLAQHFNKGLSAYVELI